MEEQLKKIFASTPAIEITDNDDYVIFSDLHMGNGGKMDDFLHNGALFHGAIENYYEKKNYKLILNGDIDELQRFKLNAVSKQWHDLYNVFKRFYNRQALYKLIGNHDFDLSLLKHTPGDIPVVKALKLRYNNQHLFIFHGHQAGYRMHKAIHLCINFILRIFANTLRIRNYSVALNNKKKYKLEKRVYDFARKMKIMALIGHTHRPLFESLSKKENLKFKIEKLCREYPTANQWKKIALEKGINRLKKDLYNVIYKRKEEEMASNLYNSNSGPLVPCIFNSGCCIGKSGITCIEISHGIIRLVYWFDKNVSQKYFNFKEYPMESLENTPYYRVILKKENLNYLFTRITLLSA